MLAVVQWAYDAYVVLAVLWLLALPCHRFLAQP